MSDLSGGCLCGAIRYRLATYTDAGYCHCPTCRRLTGAPVAAWALAPATALTIESGQPASYQSRRFCASCGSSLFVDRGENVRVLLGTLDDPGRIEPAVHCCIEHQVSWLHLNDLLPVFEGPELPAPATRRPVRGPADPSVTPDVDLSLREITDDNLGDILNLDVAGNQRRYVATNAMSIAQGYAAGDAWMRAIYAGELPIGFVMASTMHEDELGLPLAGDPDLWRFMIDSRYQGLGLGRRALDLVIAQLRTWPGTRAIWLSVVPGTGSAYNLYRAAGFEDTGVISGGERVMRLPVAG